MVRASKGGATQTVIIATAESSTVSIHPAPEPVFDDTNGGGVARPAVLAQLEKILSSATFIRSKRLGRFLRFTVEQCLDGRQNALKEYLVGVEVFNKLETFDPRIDSIVRVEARRLRSKLERYYLTEGRDDQIVVQFRKGSYVPQLYTREQLSSLGLGDELGGARTATRTLSVSDFSCLGIDGTHNDFCAGLTEDLISALTKVPSLRVTLSSRNGSDAPRADYALEGSVRRQAARLRISAQLIDMSSRVYVWSETYERDISDAFAVQDEISKAIVTSLRREFSSSRL